jgi:hypothetical protein
MDSRTLWFNVDSAFGSLGLDAEDLAGLTVQKHENWEDEEEWDEEEEEWGGEDGEDVSWGDEGDDVFDDENDDQDEDWDD